ncbi:MAG: hypothetical protein LBP77_00815 [Rickettsiales bacterium]|nr:hypothetical protein [Rickettsiales bacterium]
MPGTVKKSKSNEKDINQQLYNTIYTKVTAENYQENQDETSKKCKRLFKQGANPKTLAELEEILRERQDEQAIAKRLELSKPGASPEALAELGKSVEKKREHYNNYIQHFLPALLGKITQSTKLDKEKAKEIGRIISEIISKSSNKYSKIEEQPINSIKEEIPVSSTGMTENNVESPMTQDQTQQELESLTKEEVCVSESDSGINSPGLTSSSRRSSISSTLSSTEEDSNPQKEETGNKVLLEQTAEEEPAQVSSQCLTLGSRKKENMDPDGQATQMTGSQPLQPEEKKNTAPIVQKPSANKNNSKGTPPEKQPNNRNLHVALVAGCALSIIGCIVAGAMTSGLVGAGLLAMATVFAIAAVAELHSNFLSSKLTSINVSPLVNDKELTAL